MEGPGYFMLVGGDRQGGGIDGTREESYRPPVCMNAFLGYVLRNFVLSLFKHTAWTALHAGDFLTSNATTQQRLRNFIRSHK